MKVSIGANWRTASKEPEHADRPAAPPPVGEKEFVSWPRVVGALLVVIGAAGFLTVADDLHHVGELLGVGSVFFIGILLLVAGSPKSRSGRLAVWSLAGAVGLGAVAGAAIDNMPAGVGVGSIIGLLMAAVAGRRRDPARRGDRK
jgi:hypothetical protein